MGKKVIEPFNIHLDAFWEHDLKPVEMMIRKLDVATIKKLYGCTITITDKPMFPHPVTGESMVGDTRYFRGKPYLIILGSKPTPRILYHEVAHYIGIDDEVKAMDFAREKETEFLRMTGRMTFDPLDPLRRDLDRIGKAFRESGGMRKE